MKNLKLLSITLSTLGIFNTAGTIIVAQNKLSFGLNVGAGIPMGDYSKTDSTRLPLSGYTSNAGKGNDTTKYNGFAKTGFHFSIFGQYMLAGPIGVKLLVGGTMNSYDITAFNSTVASIYAENPG